MGSIVSQIFEENYIDAFEDLEIAPTCPIYRRK